MDRPRVGVKKRACDACHQRKIQCDGILLQCNWCKHHDLVCTFNRTFGRRKRCRKPSNPNGANQNQGVLPQRTGRYNLPPPLNTKDSLSAMSPTITSSLDADMLLGMQNQIVENSSAKSARSLPHAGLGGFYFDGFHLGGISSENGIPFFSEQGEKWIQARTGSTIALPTSCLAGSLLQLQRQALEPSACIDGTWQFPDKSIVEAYFSIFCKSTKKYVFPIIEEASFMDIVHKAYDACRNSESLDTVRAKACVLSFISVMVHMEGKIDLDQTIDASRCAAQVQHLMPYILAEATCESLQVCAMLCMYNVFAGNTAMAATFLSIACRFALMLGAHMNPYNERLISSDGQDAHSTKHYLRRLFWHCYMFDKDICLRAGYPPVIDDDHCDLALPPGYKQIDHFEGLEDNHDRIPGDMRLTIIKSKVIKLLYCATAFRKSDAELLKDVRELDEELERWRTSILPQYRPHLTPSYRMRLEPSWNKSKKVHVIVIHLEFYFLLALIHSASGRCRAWVSSETDYLRSITSSQALALQASRSTLVNLHTVMHVLNRGDFWFFVLYPISASLTIFCNLLLSPLNSQAKGDLQLLQSVPMLIKDMHPQPVTPKEGARIEKVEEFVVELRRLAKCAMERTFQKQNKTIKT